MWRRVGDGAAVVVLVAVAVLAARGCDVEPWAPCHPVTTTIPPRPAC